MSDRESSDFHDQTRKMDPANESISKALQDLKGVAKIEEYQKALKNMKEMVAQSSLLKDIEEDVNLPIFSDMKSHTVKLVFPYAGKPYLRNEVLEALFDAAVSPFDLLAVGPTGDNSKWLVTLTSKDAVVDILKTSPVIRDHTARVFSLTTSLVQCRVHWLPPYIPQSHVAVFMSRYGKVHSVKWDKTKIQGYSHVRTSIRNLVIELYPTEVLPSKGHIFFENEMHSALITMPGRGPICLRCSKIGHTRSACTAVYCRHCSKYDDHSSEECTVNRSYAARASAGNQQNEDREAMQQDIPEEESTVTSHSNIPNSVVDQERGENLVASSPKRGSSTATKSVENVDTNQTITDDEMAHDLKSDDDGFTSQQTLLQLTKEQDPDLFVSADDADISADSTLSLDVHLNKRSKLGDGT